MKIINVQQGSEEWLKIRKSGLGGSDAAAALGLSKWKTPRDLWQEKRSASIETQECFRYALGHLMEDVVKGLYTLETGEAVLPPPGVIISDNHPFMIFSPDGYTKSGRLVECKSSGTYEGWGPQNSDEIPSEYMIQVQHGMYVADLDVCDLSVLICANQFKIYEIKRDDLLIKAIIEAEEDFWDGVLNNIEPAPKIDDLAKLDSSGASLEASEAIVAAITDLLQIKQKISQLQVKRENLEESIKLFMGKHDALTCDGKDLVTWKKPMTSQFNLTLFKKEHPELYAKFLHKSETTRRFLIK